MAISQPMATLEDLMEVGIAYPVIPETDDSQIEAQLVRGRQLDRRQELVHSGLHNGRTFKDPPPRRTMPEPAPSPAPRHENGHKRKQDASPDAPPSSRRMEEVTLLLFVILIIVYSSKCFG